MRIKLVPELLLLILSLPAPALSSADFVMRPTRTGKPPRIDGKIDETEWKDAARAEAFVQFEPQRGKAASEPTHVYVLYDDRYIYFGFRCHDSQPDRISGQLNRRDSDLLQDDAVAVILDTFHDRRSGYFFLTNPLGTQNDGRIAADGNVVDSSWDASWTSAASRFDRGWMAEIAIPFTSLRFHAGRDETWGINLGRTCRRNLEASFWAGPLEDRFRISQYGRMEGLQLESSQRKYLIVPYVLGQYQQHAGWDGEAGVDLRYAVTPEDVASLTLNPDFATIEADQEVVNLTRFEVGLTEKRQFFLEGSEQYRQRLQTFYSRRIADIRFGGKMLGRRGGWQYSLLTAQSDPIPVTQNSTRLDSANYSVFRLQRDILKSSTVALMASNRYLDGINRGSVGLDSNLFFSRTFGFTGQVVRSHGPEKGGQWAFFLRPSYDSPTGHAHIRYSHLGDSFGDHVNAIGFIRDDDRRELDSAVEKTVWIPTGLLERISYNSNYNIYWSQKKLLRSWQIDESVNFDFRNRWKAGFAHTSEYKLFEKDFRNRSEGITVGYNTRQWQSVSASYRFGRNFDSDFRLLGGVLRHKITQDLSFEYELSRLWLDPDPGRSSTVIHVLRGTQNFTKDLYLKVFFQTNSVIDRRNIQAVFVWRYLPPFGTVQFAYQRGTAAFGQHSDQGNTLFIKFSYVFQ